MTIDPSVISDPTAGESAGISTEQPGSGTQTPPVVQQPAGRTFTDADMAAARRSWQADAERYAQRERQAAIESARAEWERQNAPKPQADDPWSQVADASVAQLLRSLFDYELNKRLTPFEQGQQDLALSRDEADVRAKYPDYQSNRRAILEFAVANGIGDLNMAYRAWKFDSLSTLDPKKIGDQAVAEYIKKKTGQASQTPAVEGRGGAPAPSKQTFKDRDEMDEAAKQLFRSAQESSV